jgi:hypothetical protein
MMGISANYAGGVLGCPRAGPSGGLRAYSFEVAVNHRRAEPEREQRAGHNLAPPAVRVRLCAFTGERSAAAVSRH